MWKIQLFKLNFDEREREAVMSVLDSQWLTMGERTGEFEAAFRDFLGHGVECLTVANGTAALHMALLALEVGPRDEVVIPALTFVASANTVRAVGATPVLADCNSFDDWNISADSIARCLSPRTKAVMVVHYAGFPCDMPAIVKLCRERGLRLIEDVAHAPGASVADRKCGTWGDVGCFSFFSNKNLSVGEGGMVTSGNPELIDRLKHLRSHGMSTLTLDRHRGRAITYDVARPGLNYRMDEIRSALGCVQLRKLSDGNIRRKELTNRYRSNLQDSLVKMPFERCPTDSVSAYHILPILLPTTVSRETVIHTLRSQGIQSSIHYPPFWSFSAYSNCFSPDDAPLASEVCSRELTLPLFPTMTDSEVDTVTAALLGCL